MISVRRGWTYIAPSTSAWQVGAMNRPSCSMVGLRKTGAVSRMKSIQNWPGISGSAGAGPRRISRSSKPFASSVPANNSSTMNTTRWPRSRRTSPIPTQLLVGPKAPSGKKTIVRASVIGTDSVRLDVPDGASSTSRRRFGGLGRPAARRRRPRHDRALDDPDAEVQRHRHDRRQQDRAEHEVGPEAVLRQLHPDAEAVGRADVLPEDRADDRVDDADPEAR